MVTTIKNKILCAVGLVLLCVVGACTDTDVIFDEFVALPQSQWSADSLAIFRTNIADTTSSYDIDLQVRNTNDYAYANLWLFVDIIDQQGNARRDTIQCILAEPDGSWRGSGWGSLYTLRQPYLQGVRFAHSGALTIRLTQGMREVSLDGLHDIGLIIEKSKAQ